MCVSQRCVQLPSGPTDCQLQKKILDHFPKFLPSQNQDNVPAVKNWNYEPHTVTHPPAEVSTFIPRPIIPSNQDVTQLQIHASGLMLICTLCFMHLLFQFGGERWVVKNKRQHWRICSVWQGHRVPSLFLLFLPKISCSQEWLVPPTSEEPPGGGLHLQKALSFPKPLAQRAKRRGDRSSEDKEVEADTWLFFFFTAKYKTPQQYEKRCYALLQAQWFLSLRLSGRYFLFG